MTSEFDPHTIIRELAEAEWECPDRGEDVGYSQEGVHMDWGYRRFQDMPHSACRGTGRIVPFASLRVPRCVKPGPHWHYTVHYNPSKGKPCDEGWIPEPDTEKALRRISLVLADDVRDESEAQHLVDNMEDDSLLLLARAWLGKKRKETL